MVILGHSHASGGFGKPNPPYTCYWFVMTALYTQVKGSMCASVHPINSLLVL